MRYVELSITLAPEYAAECIGKTDPFGVDNVAVFKEQGGVTVVIPHANGPFSQVISTACAEARGLLDTLISSAVEIPVPWRVMVVDRELMEQNLLVDHGNQPAPAPEEGQ